MKTAPISEQIEAYEAIAQEAMRQGFVYKAYGGVLILVHPTTAVEQDIWTFMQDMAGFDTEGMRMSTAAHMPWHNGAAPGCKYVFVPGNAKPINAGSIERAEHIVRCVNAHDDLVAALRDLMEFVENKGHDCLTARAALAKAGAA